MAENTAEKQSRSRRRRERLKGGAAGAATIEQPEDNVAEAVDSDDDVEDEARGLTESKGRATPGRRNRAKSRVEEAQRDNALVRPFRGIINYFAEVRDELQKVTWPTWPEAWRLSRIVIAVTIVSSLVLGALSLIASQIITLSLDQPLVAVLLFAAITGAAVYYVRGGKFPGVS